MPKDDQKQEQEKTQRVADLRQEAERLEKIQQQAAEELRIWNAVNKELKKRIQKREKAIGEIKKNKSL